MVLTAFAGGALLILLLVDILGTVFHPEGHGGPVHRLQNRFLWWLLHRPAKSLGGPTLLSFCGPLIVAGTIVLWGLWLIVAFALMYAPWMGSFSQPVPGEPLGWLEALYFSGSVVSTLGIGDLVPTLPALRLLTAVEALSGFALFAVTTTYVLALTQRVGAEQVLALELSVRFARVQDREGGATGPGDPQLAAWSSTVARRLLEVVHAHAQYPALHYFRPVDPRRSLLLQLRPLIESVQRGRLEGPGGDTLEASVRLFLAELDRGCLPPRDRAEAESAFLRPTCSLGRKYQRLLGHLDYPTGTAQARGGTH